MPLQHDFIWREAAAGLCKGLRKSHERTSVLGDRQLGHVERQAVPKDYRESRHWCFLEDIVKRDTPISEIPSPYSVQCVCETGVLRIHEWSCSEDTPDFGVEVYRVS